MILDTLYKLFIKIYNIKINDKYFYLNDVGIIHKTFYKEKDCDKFRIVFGNYFFSENDVYTKRKELEKELYKKLKTLEKR